MRSSLNRKILTLLYGSITVEPSLKDFPVYMAWLCIFKLNLANNSRNS